jgi:hypothetical protein
MPTSVAVTVGALATLLGLNGIFGVLAMMVHPEAGGRVVISLLLGALILWGLVVGHRLAWQWGRILGLLAAILLTAVGFMVPNVQPPAGQPDWVPAVESALTLIQAACLWTIFFSLGRPSAKEHFRLRCPGCGRFTSKAADFWFNRAKCAGCQRVWT